MKIAIITISTFLFFLSSPCIAADFSSSVHSAYTLTATQNVDVNHTITITNNTAARYPTKYNFLLRSVDFHNLKLVGMGGVTINPNTSPSSQGTEISFNVPKPIVGLGKTQTYRLSYQDSGLMMHTGPASEMMISPLGIHDSTASISAQIVFSTANCPNPITEPVATQANTVDGITSLHFDGLTTTTSLALHCGDTRYITMNLNYVLENTNMTPIETQITLPPDTDHQLFSFSRIEPKPINLTTDFDGNPIATFKLEPKEQRQITVQANGILSTQPNGLSASLSPNQEYISAQPFWPVSDNGIKKRAHELKTPTAILEALISTANYNEEKNRQLIRQGGKAILTSPAEFSGQDYVDAFITLNRASGIMSRRLVGFVTTPASTLRPYTFLQNKLHVWADYYDTDNKNWVAVDPTWVKTTNSQAFNPINDVSHIVLAINGSSDTIPYPAGFYYTKDNPAPEATVTDIQPFTMPSPAVTAQVKQSFLSSAKLVISNTGISAVYHQPITITVGSTTQESVINRLPLGGQVIIPLQIPQKHGKITLTINQQTIAVNEPPFNFTSQFTVAGAVVAISGILAAATRRILVSRRRR